MVTPFDRRTALKLAAGACLAGPLVGAASAQTPPPQPPPPPPSGAKPSNLAPVMPAGPASPAKTTAVPNAPTYPTEIGGRSLEEWIRDVDNSDPSVRAHAIQVVVEFGPSARKALPAITRQVKRLNDLSPQAYAIIALAELVPQSTPPAAGASDPYTTDAVNALIAELENPEAVIRFRAATALGYIGPPARNAVNSLIPQLKDRMSWEIRKAARFALGTVSRDVQGWPMTAALEALATGIGDTVSKDVRLEGLQAVIRLGAPAPQTPLPRLGNMLKQRLTAEKDRVVLIWVRVAMMALDANLITPPNVNAVAKELKSADPELRVATARALALMGPAAKNTIQDLIDTLPRATDPILAIEVCRALGRMGHFAERAIPSLETMDKHTDEGVRVAARLAITDIKKAVELAKQQPMQPPVK